MATLVLGAVGTALGGPVGGALGSLIGQAIDQQLLGSGPKRGPRLGDLAVQTSSYGTMIPRVYGSMRVAGSVIWATDLKEGEQAVSGGKGGSDELRYSYTASFAVALSSRPGGQIGRVWADGKLMRGAAGDLKVAGTMRVLPGNEDQDADPLIASIEGTGKAPGFRGMLVVVFEDLALAEFGNRIPMLTFEVIADAGSVAATTVLGDASGGLIECMGPALLGGYAAHGSDIASALAPLIDVLGINLRDHGAALTDLGAVQFAIGSEALGCSADDKSVAGTERTRAPLSSLPAALALGYFDPARDYQAGLASVGEADGRARKAIEFAATLTAEQARALADGCLSRAWAGRDRVRVHLPPSAMTLQPGDRLGVDALAGAWQVESVDVAAMIATVDLVRASGSQAVLVADAGRASAAVDTLAAPTVLALLDLPGASGSGLTLAGASAGPWRPVSVTLTANGTSLPTATIVQPTLIGTTAEALGAGPAEVVDELSSVDVTMVDPAAWLTGCDDDALAMGVNLAMIGDELVQFGRVDPVAQGRFRLSRLLRGRRGTEWAIVGHGGAERFVVLDPARLVDIAVPAEMVGAEFAAQAHGLADGASAAVTSVASGEALRPLAPCHLRLERAGGGLLIGWVRRSRAGFAWLDGSDAALGEASERYRVRINCGAKDAEWFTDEPMLQLPAPEIAALGAGFATVSVAQLGDRGASRELVGSIEIGG